jgi:hypothetical protein
MAAAKTNTSPMLAELRKFAANVIDLPYEHLLPTAAEAGWEYRLVQRDVVFTPLNEYMVTFDVLVGREGAFEPLDAVSVTIPASSGRPVYPVSLVARVQAMQTLIYLFFGRLPPQPAPAEHVEVKAPTGGGDIVLPDDGGEYVDRGPADPIQVVASHEPDGVPIFVDLYALGDPSAEVIEAVLDEVDNFLERASSVETINAMGAKNPMMIKFIKDLGTPEDSAKFMDMVSRRRNLVAPPVLSNARRRSAQAAN